MPTTESVEAFVGRGGKITKVDAGVRSSWRPRKRLRTNWHGVDMSAQVKRVLEKPEPQTRELLIDAAGLGRVENRSIKEIWNLRTGIPGNPLEKYLKPDLSLVESKVLFYRLELRLSFKEVGRRTGRKAAAARQLFHRLKLRLIKS